MLQISQNLKNGKIEIVDVPIPSCKKNGVIVKTIFSCVSMGTESMKVRTGKMNIIEKAKEKPEQVKQVLNTIKQLGIISTYRKVMNKLDSLSPLGYSLSGIVVETGSNVNTLKIGDKVACGGGNYATHSEFNYIPENLCVKLKNSINMKYASMATIGAIAIQGLRQANLQFGETIGIVGMGLIGQLMLQISKASGFKVLAIDIDPERVELSLKHGASSGAIFGKDNLKEISLDMTEGFGLDAVFLASSTKSNAPVEIIPEIIRDRGRIVDIGITNLDIPWQPYYDKELNISMSRSYGPGRYDPLYEEHSIDYPISYVRFTEQRNMRTFIDLVESERMDLDYIISKEIDFSESDKFYNNLYVEKNKYLSVVFRYKEDKNIDLKSERTIINDKKIELKKIVVGCIGAGNFAKTMLFPELKKVKDVTFYSLSTSTGISAKDSMKKFNFTKITTDPEELLKDKNINLLMVLTRHSTHSKYVIEGLKRDLFVYTEKPLCIDEDQLKEIDDVYKKSKGDIFVGYNRRFSPYIIKMKNFFEKMEQPKHIYYRVNAGYLEKTNWYNDFEEGNRFIGEGGHFVDTCLFLINKKPIALYASFIGLGRTDEKNKDNISLTIDFEDGSVANILYYTFGDKSLPKEYVEISSGMQTAVLENFKRLTFYRNGSEKKINILSSGKGHKEEMFHLSDILLGKRKNPFDFEYLKTVSLITFKAIESANKGVRFEI